MKTADRRRTSGASRKARPSRAWLRGAIGATAAGGLILALASGSPAAPSPVVFTRRVLAPVGPEPALELRLFPTPVKTDSRGQIITGPTSDPVKNIVGAEAAGTRAGIARFAKIMFGASYDDGRPNPSHRINPNSPSLSSGSEHWPFRPQPFRGWPSAVAVTPDGAKLYVALPGREGYPDSRVAVVNTANRSVTRWIDLRPAGQTRATRPVGIAVSPVNTGIAAAPYVVVLNQYGNFASVIDTRNDAVLGEFETDFYGEDLVFNASGTRLYTTDRFKNQVHAFRIDPGPTFVAIGEQLFKTDEEVGLRWFFTESYSDDGQKSCGHCHWQSRHDGSQWNVGANGIGGVKAVPTNKDLADNWPEWFEGLNNNMTAYASACNGELVQAERVTTLFPQANLVDRFAARDAFVRNATAANSAALGRSDLNGDARSIGYYDMAFDQILWTQNETRRMPNPRAQFPTMGEASQVARGRTLFSTEVAQGGAGCASCHKNGNQMVDGVSNDTTQDYNIYEPGVVSETTVDGDGPFRRLTSDYFFVEGAAPADEGSRQNISSRNTRHLRTLWDAVPRWLHHGFAHSVREVVLTPDSPLLGPGERGFNFRTVRTDATRRVAASFLGGPAVVLPTEVPISIADSSGVVGGDGKGPILVSLDAPTRVAAPDAAYPDGRLLVDQLGTSNLAPIVVVSGGAKVINPVLATNHVQVIKDTHGKTSHLSAADLDALVLYVMSLQ